MSKNRLFAVLATAVVFGASGYATGRIHEQRIAADNLPQIATNIFVRAVCGTDVGGCRGVITERANSEGHREFVVLNGTVYNKVGPRDTLYPADTIPAALGLPCTGIPIGEYDRDGDCTFTRVNDMASAKQIDLRF